MPDKPTLFYKISRAAIRNMIRLFLGGVTVVGAENIPTEGPVILASNHRAHVDPPYLSLLTKRPLFYMAKEELFKVPLFGGMIRRLGAFPVKRGTADRAALRRAIEILKAGCVVVIFPEGTRSEDGELQTAERGFALIARQSGAPIVPVAIEGTEGILPKGSAGLRRGAVRITIGKPMTVSAILAAQGDEKGDALTIIGAATMAAIEALIFSQAKEKKESKNLSLAP